MFTFFCPIQSSATIDAPHALLMSLPTDASQRLLLTVPSPIHLHTLHGLVGKYRVAEKKKFQVLDCLDCCDRLWTVLDHYDQKLCPKFPPEMVVMVLNGPWFSKLVQVIQNMKYLKSSLFWDTLSMSIFVCVPVPVCSHSSCHGKKWWKELHCIKQKL